MTPVVVHVVGVRPNYVKASAVLAAAAGRGGARHLLVDTGQHYDEGLRGSLYRDLGLPEPDLHLKAGSGSHGQQTAAILASFEEALLRLRPAAVVVYGDVNSTMACALAAAKAGFPLAHVEAGLRSFDRAMPEEINRVVTDALADLLLTPSRDADENLAREGAPEASVRFVGNVMVDALLRAMPAARQRGVPGRLGLRPQGYALLTMHRPQNVDDERSLLGIVEAIEALQRELPVLFSVHPRTAQRLDATGAGARLRALPSVLAVPPVGYLDFLDLQSQAAVVVTDSGGMQEETSVLGVPCVTLLDRTERPVTVQSGTNRLAGAAPARILAAVSEARSAPRSPARIEGWDGAAGARAVDQLEAWLSRGAPRRAPAR